MKKDAFWGSLENIFFLNISFDICNTVLGAGVHRGGRTLALSSCQISRPQVDNLDLFN